MRQKTIVKQEDMLFSEEQHKIWKKLMQLQLPNVKKFGSKVFLKGFKKIQMNQEKIPTLKELNEKIIPETGWKTVRTKIRYMKAEPWYDYYINKEFPITTYMRSWDELRFTPEPDMFHDIFGHQPLMMIKEFTDIEEMFAPAFLRANKEERENIKRLAWFSREFGLIRENGEMKLFGAGFMSSAGESIHVLSGKVPVEEFTIENVTKRDKAKWSFNENVFVFNSVRELKKELAGYFDSVGS